MKKNIKNVKKKNFWRENLEALIWAFIIAMLIRIFVIEIYKIPTGSMYPTLRGVEKNENGKITFPGDKILAYKFIYYFKKPQRGDIIIFKTKGIKGIDSRGKPRFVKRLVALPGETVEIKNGHVYINGKMVTKPEIFKKIKYVGDLVDGGYGTTGHPYKVPKNCYYVLGDNSMYSNDSRYWGCVPAKNVIGKAVFIIWPKDRWCKLK